MTSEASNFIPALLRYIVINFLKLLYIKEDYSRYLRTENWNSTFIVDPITQPTNSNLLVQYIIDAIKYDLHSATILLIILLLAIWLVSCRLIILLILYRFCCQGQRHDEN